MGVKRRHFTSKKYQVEASSSEDVSSSEEDVGQSEAKVPKIKQISELWKPEQDQEAKGLYTVIEQGPVVARGAGPAAGSDSGSGSGDSSGSDSGSGSGSDTDSGSEDSDSSSEEEVPMIRPVFIAKNKSAKAVVRGESPGVAAALAAAPAPAPAAALKSVTYQKIEHNANVAMEREKEKQHESSRLEREELGGIDDTDDLDPEAEYQQWYARELQRLTVQRDKMIAKEEEEEENYRRRLELDGV